MHEVHALAHKRNNAELHGLQKFWQPGPRKGPPTVRDVPKNKLDELFRWRSVPQPFCLDVVPPHMWQCHIWPFLTDLRALWGLCVVNTHMLRWDYIALHQGVRFEPWHDLYWRFRRLWTRQGLQPGQPVIPRRWVHAPCFLSPFRPIDWNTRLIFPHYRHPMRA